jgi:lysophospholipase L1-like esterase
VSDSGSAGSPSDTRSLLRTWVPRGAFVVGAIVLVWVSAAGTPISVLWFAVGLFAACTLVFVTRQLLYGHAGDPRRLAGVGGLLVLAGALTSGLYLVIGADALPLVAAALVVLGVGWVVEAMRRVDGPQGDRLVRVTAFATGAAFLPVLITLVVILVTTDQSLVSPVAIALVAVALVALVGLVNAASELTLRTLTSSVGATRVVRWSVLSVARIAGLVVVGLVLVVVAALWSRDWILTSALVVGVLLLLLALVSNTHADVALILVAVAVLAAAPVEVAPPVPALDDGSARVLVAMGDSYMSGEGADTYFAGTDDAQGDECRRSPTSYPVVTASAGSPFTQLVFLACSGARTYHVIARSDDPGHARSQKGEPDTQTSQLASLMRQHPAFRPSLVVLSIGGNDAGFGTIAETCLAPGDCSTQQALFVSNLPKVQQALVATYTSVKKAVSKAVPNVPILVVPYPQPFANVQRCDGVTLTGNERAFIRDFVDRLDSTVEKAAGQAGLWYASDMKDALAREHLQLCDRPKAEAGINFLALESVNGISTQRFNPTRWLHNSLHPNGRGHAALGRALDAWIAQHPQVLTQAAPSTGEPPSLQGPAGAAVTAPAPQCSLTDPGQTSCQDVARRWELNEVRGLWPLGLLLLVALVLIWAACVAIVSWLPSRPDRTSLPIAPGAITSPAVARL